MAGWTLSALIISVFLLVNNTKDSSGQTPLHYAAAGGSLAVVDYLISEKFCDPTTSAQ